MRATINENTAIHNVVDTRRVVVRVRHGGGSKSEFADVRANVLVYVPTLSASGSRTVAGSAMCIQFLAISPRSLHDLGIICPTWSLQR